MVFNDCFQPPAITESTHPEAVWPCLANIYPNHQILVHSLENPHLHPYHSKIIFTFLVICWSERNTQLLAGSTLHYLGPWWDQTIRKHNKNKRFFAKKTRLSPKNTHLLVLFSSLVHAYTSTNYTSTVYPEFSILVSYSYNSKLEIPAHLSRYEQLPRFFMDRLRWSKFWPSHWYPTDSPP